MRIDRIEIDGFGTLRQESFDFQPGLNLVFGPNEAGKSTLQQAILAHLYGFYVRQRPSSREKRQHARFRPWHGEAYGGKLFVTLDNHTEFIIARRFDKGEPETQIFDARTGESITDQFLQRRRGHVDFSERCLGMTRSVFEAVACVPQGLLISVNQKNAEEINDALMRMIDSAGTSVSARLALERLSSAIRALGTDRSKTGPVYKTRLALQAARHALEERKALTQSLATDYRQIDALKRQRDDLLEKERDLEQDLRRLKYQDLQTLVIRHQELSERRKHIEEQLEQLQADRKIPLTQRDTVLKLSQERKVLRQQRQTLLEKAQRLSTQLQETRKKMEELPPAPDFWRRNDLDGFFDLHRRWRSLNERADEVREATESMQENLRDIGVAPGALEKIAAMSSVQLKEQQEKEDSIEKRRQHLEEESDRMRLNQRYLNLGRVAVVIILLSFFLITFASSAFVDLIEGLALREDLLNLVRYLAIGLALIWLGGEAALLTTSRTRREELEAEEQELELELLELQEFLRPFGVESVQRLIEAHHRYLEASRLNSSLQERMLELQEVEKRLASWAALFNISNITKENLVRVEEMMRHGIQQEAYLDELNEHLKALELQIRERDQRIGEINETLQGIFKAANCWTGNFEQDARSFLTLADQTRAYDQLMQDWDKVNEIEREMLKGQSIEEIEDALENLREEFGDAAPATNLPPQKTAETMLEEIRGRRQSLEVELAGLQERVLERESQLPDLSEIEEQIALNESQLNKLILQRQALELACETLAEVSREAHKDYAPRLARAVATNLAAITDDKYQELYIDPSDFSVRISHPEARSLVPMEFLSYGTQEQIYILLRAAIAHLFSATSEKVPLFFEDPLAHADERRQENALRVIAHLAKSNQIIYFTNDKEVIDILAAMRADYHLIPLHGEKTVRPLRWAAGTAARRKPLKNGPGSGEEKASRG